MSLPRNRKLLVQNLAARMPLYDQLYVQYNFGASSFHHFIFKGLIDAEEHTLKVNNMYHGYN